MLFYIASGLMVVRQNLISLKKLKFVLDWLLAEFNRDISIVGIDPK